MELTGLKVNEYLDILMSEAPAPGGGSASALAGAQGAALIIMVCGLTLSREKYSEFHETCRAAKEKAEGLLKSFITAVDKDAEAFNIVAAAYKMPKESETQKIKRSEAIEEGTVKSTEIPLSVMKSAQDGLEIVSGLLGKTNPGAMSDLGVAALNLTSCARGAWLNVEINLPGIKEPGRAKFYHDKGLEYYHHIDSMADKLYRDIAEEI